MIRSSKTQSTYTYGLEGQHFVENRMIDFGYMLYKKNLKYIGVELDLVMYRYIKSKNLLCVRVIEVKTRKNKRQCTDLNSFGIEQKWLKARRCMFRLVDEIKAYLEFHDVAHKVFFDLAIVSSRDVPQDYGVRVGDEGVEHAELYVYKYIQNVNLLL